jgi:hypothetical protein
MIVEAVGYVEFAWAVLQSGLWDRLASKEISSTISLANVVGNKSVDLR